MRSSSVPGSGSNDSLQVALRTALAEEVAEPLNRISDDMRRKFALERFPKSHIARAAELAETLHDATAVGSSAPDH